MGNIINITTLKQNTDQERELDRLDDTSGHTNPYRKKVETILSQMEQWSILSSIVNYIQYDRYSKNVHNLNIKAVNCCIKFFQYRSNLYLKIVLSPKTINSTSFHIIAELL